MADEDKEIPEEEAPKAEEEAAKVVEETPKAEEEAPKAEEEAPKAEEEAPKAEEEAPKAEEEAPKAEEEAPKAEEGEKEKRLELLQMFFSSWMDLMPMQNKKSSRPREVKNVNSGIVHVLATFNNTIVTITDKRGNVIGWSTAGKMGFRGSRKSTAYAAQVVSQDACRQAMGHGLKEADVKVKGPGSGRESAVRAVQGIGIEVKSISDVTPIPHNGCRPKKARRV